MEVSLDRGVNKRQFDWFRVMGGAIDQTIARKVEDSFQNSLQRTLNAMYLDGF